MLPEIRYKNLTIKQIKSKSRAFTDLFGKEPTIYVTGTFSDINGDTVFLLSSSATVHSIGREYITLWLTSDHERVIVSPSDNSEYNFSLW